MLEKVIVQKPLTVTKVKKNSLFGTSWSGLPFSGLIVVNCNIIVFTVELISRHSSEFVIKFSFKLELRTSK